MELPISSRPRSTTAVLRTGLSTVALTTLFLGAALWVGERVAPVYSEAAQRNALLTAVASEIEAGVFGNSHAQAVRFDRLGREGFYFNQAGGDLFESRRILQHTLAKAPSLREVYLSISPYTGDNAMHAQYRGRRRMVYAQTGSLRPIRHDWRTALSTPLVRLARPDHGYGVLRRVPSNDSLRADGYTLRWAKQTKTPDQIPEHGYRRAASHAGGSRAMHEADPDLCSSLKRTLRGFVRDAGERRVVLFTPPYYETYLSEPSPCDLAATAHSLAATEENVAYLDYRDSPFKDRATWFRDSNHLNAAGSIAFTDSLRRDLDAHWGLTL